MKKHIILCTWYMVTLSLLLVGCGKKPAQQDSQDAQSQEVMEQELIEQEVTKAVVGGPYLDFTGITPLADELSVSDLVGKTDYVLIDFWATWCGPCRRFIPVLKEIYASQPEGRLEIISCSVDQDPLAWYTILSQEQMPWRQVREDEEHPCSDKYEVQYIPFTVLIDREGTIVALDPDEPELEAILLGE